jgi:hypothetical protein
MREAQKVKGLRLAIATLLSIPGCKAAELDQSRFGGMQLQVEFRESFTEFRLKSLSILMVLESHHEIISIPDDDYIAMSMMMTPIMSPDIEHIVEIDIRQQGADTAPLRRTCLRPASTSFLQNTRVQPLLDVA